MRITRVAPAGVALLLAAAASAQTIYIVDGLNRPGTHFTDLPPAAAAAQHGDTIVLRSDGGFYQGISTNKALTITGSSPGMAVILGSGAGFVIDGIPAGRDFLLQNVELFGNGGSPARVAVQACLGRVHLVRVHASDYTGQPALDVALCSAVTVRDCEFQGFPGLMAQNATLAVGGTRFFGQGGSSTALPPATGAVLIDSTAWFANVQVRGGNAWQTLAPAPGLDLINANLSMTGVTNGASARSGVLGSFAAPGFTAAVPAIRGQGSVLRLDPEVVLSATGGAPNIAGVTTTTTPIPAFTMYGVPLLNVSVDLGAATAQATVVGLPTNPMPLPGIEGRLWVDPSQMLVLGGVLGGYSGFYEYLLPPGLTLAVQLVSLQPTSIELSPPAIVHSRP